MNETMHLKCDMVLNVYYQTVPLGYLQKEGGYIGPVENNE